MDTASILPLSVHDLHERHRGVTAAICGYLAEALDVCLTREPVHSSPAQFVLEQDSERVVLPVAWAKASDRTRVAWADEHNATEKAACGLALAAQERLRGLVAVRQAQRGTRVDYYLAPPGSDPDDLEHCVLLEVSGTGAGRRNELRSRLREKVRQCLRADANLPAVATVVGFRMATILSRDVQPP